MSAQTAEEKIEAVAIEIYSHMTPTGQWDKAFGFVQNDFRRLAQWHLTQNAPLVEKHDKLVERSVGAMSIAEGDEGWEKFPCDCPMLDAVYKLRTTNENLRQSRRKKGEKLWELKRANEVLQGSNGGLKDAVEVLNHNNELLQSQLSRCVEEISEWLPAIKKQFGEDAVILYDFNKLLSTLSTTPNLCELEKLLKEKLELDKNATGRDCFCPDGTCWPCRARQALTR